jgi:hypothetical protein
MGNNRKKNGKLCGKHFSFWLDYLLKGPFTFRACKTEFKDNKKRPVTIPGRF